MELDAFFAPSDVPRLKETLRRLAAHDVSRWAVTGGVAIEMHIARSGGSPITRALHDIDFIAPSFEAIPQGLAQELLLRHVHPEDPPGKNMLQGVHPETAVRVDVFRAYGREIERLNPVTIAGLPFHVVSLQDLVARHTRLNWDLVAGRPVAPKYVRDFLRMIDFVTTEEVQAIWLEHRKSESPENFAEAARRVRREIQTRPDLLVDPVYSTDVTEVCTRCRVVERFPLAQASRILSILGYC
jgi:hypothetical protein